MPFSFLSKMSHPYNHGTRDRTPDTHGSARMADAIMEGTKERAFSLKEELTPCSVDSIEVSNGGDVTHG